MRYIPLLLLLVLPLGLSAQTQTFSSGTAQVQLIELYTSQGCSSCPPAEKWITTFVDNPRLWSKVTPVNFHVDYWDNLGWPDRYASKSYTQRQRHYKALGFSRTVATPGFVIDGRGWNGWFYGLKNPKHIAKNVGVLTVTLDATESFNNIVVSFKPTIPYSKKFKVNIAQLGFGLFDKIKNGENNGKLLRHDFVALSFQQSTLPLEEGSYSASFQLEKPIITGAMSGISVWINDGDDPTPIQSVGGFIK